MAHNSHPRRRYLAVASTAVATVTGCLETVNRQRENRRYETSVSVDASPSDLVVTATVPDSRIETDSPAVIDLAVENATDRTLEFAASPPTPFGVLYARSGSREVLLWSDAYERSPYVQTRDGRVVGGDDVEGSVRLEPGTTATGSYLVRATEPGLSAGRYVVETSAGSEPTIDGAPVRVVLEFDRLDG